MSHFSGLVIVTPDYDLSIDESLEKYDENRKVPEYKSGDVSDYDKVSFLSYYAHEAKEIDKNALMCEFVNTNAGCEGYKTMGEYMKEYPYNWYDDTDHKRFVNLTINDHEQEYADFFKERCPELWDSFAERYAENGDSWNGNGWRIDPETNEWASYSTYNPSSKFDYYVSGNRWDGTLLTKSGEYVNECLLGEIDWTPFKPEDYCKKWEKDFWGKKYHPLKKDRKWHHTEEQVPFCLVVNGNWAERGEMGWWGITTNEKPEEDWNKEFMKLIKDLPEDSECYLMDFHI